MFRVTVKPTHPTGVRRRSGMVFTRTPVGLPNDEMTREIKKDPWLVVEKVKGEQQGDRTPNGGQADGSSER